MKLLTFTMNKRRVGSLARKQRAPDVGPRRFWLAKFFLAGVTCSHYDSQADSSSVPEVAISFFNSGYDDTRHAIQRSLHSLYHRENVRNSENVSALFHDFFFQIPLPKNNITINALKIGIIL